MNDNNSKFDTVDRLLFHAERVEAEGHINAGRHMRDAAGELAHLRRRVEELSQREALNLYSIRADYSDVRCAAWDVFHDGKLVETFYTRGDAMDFVVDTISDIVRKELDGGGYEEDDEDAF
jgi:hypothetical protein